MISLTTNVCIVWKRLILMIAFIGAIIFGTSVSHAAYIAPPSTIGEAVVLIDADTKEILFAKNPDKWMHPASYYENGYIVNSSRTQRYTT